MMAVGSEAGVGGGANGGRGGGGCGGTTTTGVWMAADVTLRRPNASRSAVALLSASSTELFVVWAARTMVVVAETDVIVADDDVTG